MKTAMKMKRQYPRQFVEYDDETDEVCVNFLQRSSSSSSKWFVWLALSGKMKEDKSWVNEGKKLKYFMIETSEFEIKIS